MLIKINQVAKDFKVSLRTVQLWCKADGIKKIGNEYQLTKEIVERWEVERTQPKTQPTNENVTHTKRKKDSSFSMFKIDLIITLLVILFLITIGIIYYRMDQEITQGKTTIKVKEIEHKTEVKELRKELNDVKDVNNDLRIENQKLKIKDSLRIFKRW